MNKKIVHDALILTAFTLTLGFVLGLVYGITKEPIAAADAATSTTTAAVINGDLSAAAKGDSRRPTTTERRASGAPFHYHTLIL